MGTTFQAVLLRLTRKFSEDIAMDVIAVYLGSHTIGEDGEITEHGMGYFYQCAKNRALQLKIRGNHRLRLVSKEVSDTQAQSKPTQLTRAELRQVAEVARPCLLEYAMDELGGKSSPGLHAGQAFKFRCRRARIALREQLGLVDGT